MIHHMRSPCLIMGHLISSDYLVGSEPRSAIRDRVHQAALGPQPIQSAAQLELAWGAAILVEYLAVVSHRLDRIEHPAIVDTEPRSELAARPEQPLDHRVLAGPGQLLGGRGGRAVLLGLDEAVMHPGHDVGPGFVAVAGEWAERLLADGLAEHQVV